MTTDLKLAVRYSDNFTEIEQRFKEMVTALSGVYAALTLPKVFTAAEVLTKF